MTNTSHTLGPWSFETEGTARTGVSCEIIRDSNGVEVAFTQHHDFDGLEKAQAERHANARLIAAAPDLLQTLKESLESLKWAAMVIQDIPRNSEFTQNIQDAETLIAKLEGKE